MKNNFSLIKKNLINLQNISEDLKNLFIINNNIIKNINKIIKTNNILVIYGDKEIGKTSIVKLFLSKTTVKNIYINIKKLNLFLNKNIKNKIYFYKHMIYDFDLFVFDEFFLFSQFSQYKNLVLDFKIFFNNLKRTKNKKLIIIYDNYNLNDMENVLNFFNIKKFKLFKINLPNLEEKIKFIKFFKKKEMKLDINNIIFLAQNSKNFNEIKRELFKNKFKSKDLTSKIIGRVGKFFGVGIDEIFEKKRKKQVTLARQMSIYILKNVYNYSIVNLSRIFKQKHPSIIYSLRKVETLKSFDKKIKNIITNFEQKQY